MRQKRRQFVFRARPIQQSELDRNVVKPARPEAAIEMPQSGNDHPDDGDADVGPRLIEDEEIEARARGDIDAGVDLPASIVEKARRPTGAWLHRAVWRQEGIVLQAQRRDAVE